MTQLGNPWLEKSGKLYDLENRIVMPDRVVENIRKIKVTGLEAYHKFLEKRVLTQEEALTDPIPACNLQLIRDEVDRKQAKPTERSIVSDMKSQQVKLIDIISAHQAGRPNLDAEVLSHENSLLPPTLTNKGNMHHGNKADILKLICPRMPLLHPQPLSLMLLSLSDNEGQLVALKSEIMLIKFFGQKYLSCLTIMIESIG